MNKLFFAYSMKFFILLLLIVSFISFHPLDPYPFSQKINNIPIHNLCGILGSYLSGVMQTMFGIDIWLIILYILWEYVTSKIKKTIQRIAWIVLILTSLTLLGGINKPHLWLININQEYIEIRWGGWIGQLLWLPIRQILGSWGTIPILFFLICLSLSVIIPNTVYYKIKNVFSRLKNITILSSRQIKNKLKTYLARQIKNYFITIKYLQKNTKQNFVQQKNTNELATEITDNQLQMQNSNSFNNNRIIKNQGRDYSTTNVYSEQIVNHVNTIQNNNINNTIYNKLPPNELFHMPKQGEPIITDILQKTKITLQTKINDFKIRGTVIGLQPGPVLTVYEFQPDPGVPISKILNLEEDIALRLKVEKVRIKRLSGYNLIGIEIPNTHKQTISFREIIDHPIFNKSSKYHTDNKSTLKLVLGKDITGYPTIIDLIQMPHLLIGGSTGSGKSVGLNAMICSLLLKNLPNNVKLILIDPKMVEFSIYKDIPHLWAPVITDMHEASKVLNWVILQMEERYRYLTMLNVRNIDSFNEKITKAGGYIDISHRTFNPNWLNRPTKLELLPYVVIIIDEFADLMMICRTDIENSITRIAQKARAVGIHLILATQRPSVDVITGIIKANLTARLSYRVNTKIDSRTILDSSGGEQLLGKGDALFLAPGCTNLKRVHTPFITDEETIRLVNWIKKNNDKPKYNDDLLNKSQINIEDFIHVSKNNRNDHDLYQQAIHLIKQEQKISINFLQRKLNIGYGKATKLIDRMEDEGIISDNKNSNRFRNVLINSLTKSNNTPRD